MILDAILLISERVPHVESLGRVPCTMQGGRGDKRFLPRTLEPAAQAAALLFAVAGTHTASDLPCISSRAIGQNRFAHSTTVLGHG